MCVIGVTAGPVKQTLSSPTDESKWVFIPIEANNNDSWIPIPYDVLQKANITHLQRYFKLIRLHGNGIFSNESILPTHDKKRPDELIVNIFFSIIIMMLCIVLVILEFIQKRQRDSS